MKTIEFQIGISLDGNSTSIVLGLIEQAIE